jgi:hypothetical protein
MNGLLAEHCEHRNVSQALQMCVLCVSHTNALVGFSSSHLAQRCVSLMLLIIRA